MMTAFLLSATLDPVLAASCCIAVSPMQSPISETQLIASCCLAALEHRAKKMLKSNAVPWRTTILCPHANTFLNGTKILYEQP